MMFKITSVLKKISFSVFFILFTLKITAQADEFVFENAKVGLHENDLNGFNLGKIKFEQEEFLEALIFFDSISEKNQPYLNYLKGICYSRDIDQKEKSISLISGLKDEAAKINGYYFNLAYAYAKNDSNTLAINNYKIELAIQEHLPHKNHQLINEINIRLHRCNNLLDFKNKKNFVRVKNLGSPINTSANEYCPIIPSNEAFMIYTYRGPKSRGGKQKLHTAGTSHAKDLQLFYEDIFISYKLNDSMWDEPKSIGNINTLTHDAAVCLNADGTELFTYENVGDGKGDLYLSKFNGETWSKPVKQQKLNSHEWDGSACFIPNQDKIIFSSERKGGYGGKDLYYAERIAENVWGNIKNLGPEINTKYDEDAPFVNSDGKILFFSSNNKNSIGGYDVFRCDWLNNDWHEPYNVGPPINTVNDDIYFTVRADGKVAYYSSYKKGGDGGQDIYMVEPGIPGKPIELLQINGLVTVDGKPAAADIEVKSILKDLNLKFKLSSNKITGEFLSNLPPGDEYELTVNVSKFSPKIIKLNTTNIDSFVVLNVFAEFNSPVYENNVVENQKNITAIDSAGGNKIFDKGSFSKNSGAIKKPNLYYKVQVGAFKFPENFNYNKILGLPKILRHVDNDMITRFTMGNFETYNEALELLELVQDNMKGAFITAFYNGERKLLYQLVESKILD